MLPYALRASGNRHSVSQFYAEFAENVPTFSPLGELGGKLPAAARRHVVNVVKIDGIWREFDASAGKYADNTASIIEAFDLYENRIQLN